MSDELLRTCRHIELTVLMGSPMFKCFLHRKEYPKRCSECPKFEQKRLDNLQLLPSIEHIAIERMIEEAKKQERERIRKMPCWLAQSHSEVCPIRQALKSS